MHKLTQRGKVYGLQILGTFVQGSYLCQRRAAVGIRYRLPHRFAGGAYSGNRGARSVQRVWFMSAERGLCDPLVLHQAHRSGHYFGGYETGGMPGAQRENIFSVIIRKIIGKKYEKSACNLGTIPL